MRMCSTGPETTLLAIPALAPAIRSCIGCNVMPPGPPVPARTFWVWKTRFIYSSAPNWIETHAPTPTNGLKVPYYNIIYPRRRTRIRAYLVKRERTLVFQNPTSALHHAGICPRRSCLHSNLDRWIVRWCAKHVEDRLESPL